jgi:ABC transport system ATP-binding/permease protein
MAENVTPVVFSAENLNVSYGKQVILDNANLTVHARECIGFVGRNGCGKSTFLRVLSGMEEPDSGKVMRKRDLSVSYLPQEFFLDETKTVYDNILFGAAHITALVNEYENLSHDSDKAHILEDQINRCDGWNLKNRIEAVMDAVETPDASLPVDKLSGGEKRRVALARTIVVQPDLLILDEPTNHLDIGSIEWLEKFIASYKGTIIFVTHDRYFLDNLATRIVELYQGCFYSYQGNYSDYLVGKAKRLAIEEKSELKRQSFLRREISWIRSSPRARTCKSQSRVNRFTEAANQLPPEPELDIDLIIPSAKRLSDKVVEFDNVSFSFADTSLYKNFTFSFSPGSKIGILGKNGAGKTTLLKTVIGSLQPTSGHVHIASNVEFNYIDQERIQLDETKSVYDEIGEGRDFVKLGDETLSIWGYLKRFLFDDDRIKTKIAQLSGGEKGRLMLAKILKNGGNFIVVDEPTNDLDLQTLRLLEEALIGFKGCVLVVSHDRYFLNRVCTGILAFEDDGNIVYHVGNYDYYCDKRLKHLKASKNTEKKGKVVVNKHQSVPKIRRLRWKEERELETIEQRILKIEENLKRIESIFSSIDFFEKYGDKTNELQAELDENKKLLDSLYSRWEELENIKNS